MITKNNNKTGDEQKDDFDYSEKAQEEALLELLTHIAYMAARNRYLEFYTKWLDSLMLAAEVESTDE